MAVLVLKHPLTIGQIVIDQLKFRDHTTAADYLCFDLRGGVAQRIALIASMTGTDEAIIQQLHGSDYLAAEKVVDNLMADDTASETGEAGGNVEKK